MLSYYSTETPAAIVETYTAGFQRKEPIAQDVFILGVTDASFERAFEAWLQYAECVTVDLQRPSQTPADALREVVLHTGLTARRLEPILGVTHTQVRRILSGEQSPRDNVVRRIFDLATLAAHLAPLVNNDSTRLRQAIETAPMGTPESAAAVIAREHNLPLATMYATSVIYPRTEWPDVAPAFLDPGSVGELD
jgi:hypothetical protein